MKKKAILKICACLLGCTLLFAACGETGGGETAEEILHGRSEPVLIFGRGLLHNFFGRHIFSLLESKPN